MDLLEAGEVASVVVVEEASGAADTVVATAGLEEAIVEVSEGVEAEATLPTDCPERLSVYEFTRHPGGQAEG